MGCQPTEFSFTRRCHFLMLRGLAAPDTLRPASPLDCHGVENRLASIFENGNDWGNYEYLTSFDFINLHQPKGIVAEIFGVLEHFK